MAVRDTASGPQPSINETPTLGVLLEIHKTLSIACSEAFRRVSANMSQKRELKFRETDGQLDFPLLVTAAGWGLESSSLGHRGDLSPCHSTAFK